MIFFYSDRRVYADSFIQSLKAVLETDVRLCLFNLTAPQRTPDLVLIDGKGLHPQRLKKIVSFHNGSPVVLMSFRAFQAPNIAALVSEDVSVRDVVVICQALLGEGHNVKKRTVFNRIEEVLLKGIVQGASNKEMARDYDLALSTVKYHLQNIYKKMGVNNRTQAALKLHKTTL